MSELRDAVEMLQKLDKQYKETILKFAHKGDYEEAKRREQIRRGVEHSIKILEKMLRGELGLLRTPANYDPRKVIADQKNRLSPGPLGGVRTPNPDLAGPIPVPGANHHHHDFPTIDRK